MKSCLRLWFVALFIPAWVFGQQQKCNISISFFVKDVSGAKPLRDAYISLSGNRTGRRSAVSSPEGIANFQDLCPGNYHYTVLHAGCAPLQGMIKIHTDTSIAVLLSHSAVVLPEVHITGQRIRPEHASVKHIKSSIVEENQFKPLSDILVAVPGVTTLRTGGQISKPLIRGMNAQRIAVLNHGMPLAGQQWGNDHAPELSSFIYDSVAVVRGIAAVEYPAGHMGGALIADKKASFIDQHLHGTKQAGYFSNGRGFWSHLKLEKGINNKGGIRADVAYKAAGDLNAPGYYLRNTGVSEFSTGLLWAHKLTKSISNTLNYNYFTTTIGILRGAHIGNVSDLQEAMLRDKPFFTEDRFSRIIDLPRQEVSHHTISNLTSIQLSKGNEIRLKFGYQRNDRSEFDFRRSGEHDRPSLSLVQHDLFGEAVYSSAKHNTGFQYRITDNTNNPETGILPLIPDFRSHRVGMFYSSSAAVFNREIAFGGRYEFTNVQAFPIERSIPLVVLEEFRSFHTATANFTYPIISSTTQLITWEGQITMRAPEVNELYSFGLHQGVAGIEEGDRNLKTEFGYQHHFNTLHHFGNLTLRADAYMYLLQNFINLEPTGELRSTIRGAFPVFAYVQHPLAMLNGIDAQGEYSLSDNVTLEVRGSILYAQNIAAGAPIAWMPANRALTSATFVLPSFGRVKNPEWKVSSLIVARQSRLLPEQDFMPPPPGYSLINTSFLFRIPIDKSVLQVSVMVENLFNRKYRDFLNRWKYFADDIGRNVILSARFSF